MNIPEGINYKEADEATNNAAIEAIKNELKKPQYLNFDKIFYCGPNLWKRYILIPDLGGIPKRNIIFKVPSDGTFIDKTGKLIQTKNDYQLIWDQLTRDFKDSNFIIRKLMYPSLF